VNSMSISKLTWTVFCSVILIVLQTGQAISEERARAGKYALRSTQNTEYVVVITRGNALFGEQTDNAIVGISIPDNAQPTRGATTPYAKSYPGKPSDAGVENWDEVLGTFDGTHLSVQGSYYRAGKSSEGRSGKMIFGLNIRVSFSGNGKCAVERGEILWLEAIDLDSGRKRPINQLMLPVVSCAVISTGN
jgi:hypothetical protein